MVSLGPNKLIHWGYHGLAWSHPYMINSSITQWYWLGMKYHTSMAQCMTQGKHANVAILTTLSHSTAQFYPTMGAVTHRWNRRQQQMHFLATLLIMLIEIRFNFQIYVQCSEKAISKITFNFQWNLKQISHPWHILLSKGFENNGVWVAW